MAAINGKPLTPSPSKIATRTGFSSARRPMGQILVDQTVRAMQVQFPAATP